MKHHSAAKLQATPVLSSAMSARNQFDQFLKESGHYFGTRGRLLVQVFCDSKEPLSAKEMLYRVKRLDPMLSFGTIYRFLTLIAASGLATTIPRERRGPLRYQKVSAPVQVGQCKHAHLVCKDCGAFVEKDLRSEL